MEKRFCSPRCELSRGLEATRGTGKGSRGQDGEVGPVEADDHRGEHRNPQGCWMPGLEGQAALKASSQQLMEGDWKEVHSEVDDQPPGGPE